MYISACVRNAMQAINISPICFCINTSKKLKLPAHSQILTKAHPMHALLAPTLSSHVINVHSYRLKPNLLSTYYAILVCLKTLASYTGLPSQLFSQPWKKAFSTAAKKAVREGLGTRLSKHYPLLC